MYKKKKFLFNLVAVVINIQSLYVLSRHQRRRVHRNIQNLYIINRLKTLFKRFILRPTCGFVGQLGVSEAAREWGAFRSPDQLIFEDVCWRVEATDASPNIYFSPPNTPPISYPRVDLSSPPPPPSSQVARFGIFRIWFRKLTNSCNEETYTFRRNFLDFFKQAIVSVTLKCKTFGRKIGLSKNYFFM